MGYKQPAGFGFARSSTQNRAPSPPVPNPTINAGGNGWGPFQQASNQGAWTPNPLGRNSTKLGQQPSASVPPATTSQVARPIGQHSIGMKNKLTTRGSVYPTANAPQAYQNASFNLHALTDPEVIQALIEAGIVPPDFPVWTADQARDIGYRIRGYGIPLPAAKKVTKYMTEVPKRKSPK